MDSTLFVYGTLLVDDVLREVTGRSFPAVPAVLPGYASYRLRGCLYPGIVAEPGARTPGLLLYGIDGASRRRIDGYESDGYERRAVIVHTARGPVRTHAYVIPARARHLLSSRRWSRERFERAHALGRRR